MRKEDMTAAGLLLEAAGCVAVLLYVFLQIYGCMLYGAGAVQLVMNILVLLLVYAGLGMLEWYPEKVNRLSPAECRGKVRKYTISMIRLIKLIFVISLLFTAVCDVIGSEVNGAYSLIVVGLILFTAAFYEVRIIRLLGGKT